MNSSNSAPQPWEIDVVVWPPGNREPDFHGLIQLLHGRAVNGWQLATVVKDISDAGPCWIFQRPVQPPTP